MKRAACLLLSALLLACGGGGGGGSSPAPAAPPGPLRTGIPFCYYGMNAMAAAETTDHASCVAAAEFYGPLEQLAALAQANGRPVIIYLPACDVPLEQVEPETTFWLQRIANAGYLRNVLAVRPCDEPDNRGMSDAEVKARITAVHAAMAKFDATRAKPITMFYVCNSGRRPGIAFVDWPGCDDYGAGCSVIDRYYPELEGMANTDPDVRLVLIGGVANPWRQDLQCMVDKVRRDGRYAMLQAFIYQTVSDGPGYVGARDNGTLQAIKAAVGQLR